MIRVSFIGADEAINRLKNISLKLFDTILDATFESAELLRAKCETERPEVKMIALKDPTLPGATVVPYLPEDVYKTATKEVGEARAFFMRLRCPAQLYFRTAFRKYIKPSPIFKKIVEENWNIIANLIREKVLELFG